MHDLVMPQTLSRIGVECDETIRKQIVSLAISAVKVESCCPEGNKGDSGVFVYCELTPIMNTARRGLQRFGGPRFGTWFARHWNAVKSPFQLSCLYVVGAYIT